MTEEERKEFNKAYVELNEIIKKMSIKEKQKIPEGFMRNLNNEMDKDYKFVIDKEKSILEQNFKIETKALLVELFEKYLAPDEEKEFWEKYDKICLNIIEDEKREQYNPDNLFIKKNREINKTNNNSNLPIEVKEKNIFIKFVEIIKKIFNLN